MNAELATRRANFVSGLDVMDSSQYLHSGNVVEVTVMPIFADQRYGNEVGFDYFMR